MDVTPIESPLRWAGSKRKLLGAILPHFPRTFGCFHEPFFGGGSVFLGLRPERASLSDASPQLINAFRVMRDSVDELIVELRSRMYSYDPAVYSCVRAGLNAGEGSAIERAAAFVYINTCCFNGLWRVNRQGKCNVPFGDVANPVICDESALRACSTALRGAHLYLSDFAGCAAHIESGDCVYIDSPYVPLPGKSSFTGYTAEGFKAADHVRLAEMFRRLVDRGAMCIASNSDTPDARALYRGFETVGLSRSGAINSKTSARGKVGEILILGGQWDKRGDTQQEAVA